MGAAKSSKASTLELCRGFSRSYYAGGQNISKGKEGSELKRELATSGSYRILKKKNLEREKDLLGKNYHSTYPSDNQATTLQ